MKNHQLLEVIDNFHNLNIVVIGDIMLDKYIWGNVNRISPEAPVPVVNVDRVEYRVGGAGNVATNLAGMSCHSSILAITGDDHSAAILEKHLKEHNVKVLFNKDKKRCTTVKSRIIAQRQQLVRMDNEVVDDFSSRQTEKLLEKITANPRRVDAIILSDYAKGLLTKNFIQNIISGFSSTPVIIDPKVRNYERYRGATVVKPNYKEFCQAVNKEHISLNDLEKYAAQIVEKYDFDGLIVTLGENGVFYFDDGRSEIIPTEAHEVYDVSGAGDTFTAAFAPGLIISNDFAKAARIGNLASAVAVEKVGTAAVTRKELIKKLE